MMVRLKHKLIKLIALKWSPLNNTAVIILNPLQVYLKKIGKCLIFQLWKLVYFSGTEHVRFSSN